MKDNKEQEHSTKLSTKPVNDNSDLAKSVGIVTPQTIHFDTPIILECNRILPKFDLVVETYGEPNADNSNAILICHALSGSHHVAGYHTEAEQKEGKAGWWDTFIGKGKPIDTDKYFVVCLNNIGSCYGSTGPISINPKTNQIYANEFPLITIKDWVKTQVMLADHLGVQKWHAIVGGSMGGMQALQWSVSHPERLKKCVVIASTPKLSAQNIAFNEVARQSILSDPDFHNGQYLAENTYPKRGLILARMVGHITYLTDEAMKHKFGRDHKTGEFMYGYDVEFQVESYLRYQGENFSKRFDANSYLLMTKALDYFDPTRGIVDDTVNNEIESPLPMGEGLGGREGKSLSESEALTETLKNTECQFLVVSFSTDWRFAPERSQEIVNALIANAKPVSYVNIDAPYGHDSFLFDIPRYNVAVRNFLDAD